MVKKLNLKKGKRTALKYSGLVFVLFFGLSAAAFGQTDSQTQTTAMTPQSMVESTVKPAVTMPVLTNLQEISIGMTADDVRDKLGKAKIDDKDGFYYQISDEEFVQIRVDDDKKVQFIAVTYTDKNKSIPTYADVFGADAVETAKPDGSVYNLVRYPQAGYWVAYTRTTGDKPVVVVTMQKM